MTSTPKHRRSFRRGEHRGFDAVLTIITFQAGDSAAATNGARWRLVVIGSRYFTCPGAATNSKLLPCSR